MKKIIFAFVMCMSALMLCPAAYAKEAKAEAFEITGGIDFSKDTLSTFDSSKTITGTADENTEIKIEVYSLKANEAILEDDCTFTVGISGIFTKTIDLNLGENFVVISSGEEEGQRAEITISRKNEAVKKALESGVYLP